jgi:hypothetical protein
LPRPVVIPKVMALTALGDVRDLFELHLPAEHRAIAGAARGEDEPGDVEIALRLVRANDNGFAAARASQPANEARHPLKQFDERVS